MPPHERHINAEHSDPNRKIAPKAQNIFSSISADIKALNSSILIISQKIKFLVRNEKILGRNLLVLNKKIKEIHEERQQGQSSDFESFRNELAELSRKVSENSEAISQLQSELEYVKQNYAKAEQVSEVKYIVDSINPLEFVTIKDVKELVSEARKK